MTDQLWRLTWALPLVIAIGVLLIHWLKRMGVGTSPDATPAEPVLLSTTALTEHTRVLVIDVAGQQFVVFESSARISVQTDAVQAHQSIPLAFRRPMGMAPMFPWRPSGRTPR
jgi:flagellar biogenesis protein FliO